MTDRPAPFDLGFPGPDFIRERFGEIAEEAEARDATLTDPGAFLLLGQVGRTLQELRVEDSGGADGLRTFGAFLFHAFHYDRVGRPHYRLEKGAARYLVESDPVPEGWDRSLPEEAGYLQLPEHLFWTRPDPEGPAEAIDGIFWTTSVDSISVLAITGMRGDRAGFSVIPLPPVPLADAGEWIHRKAREEGDDFETNLPGGELDRLYSVETAGELLKLLARALGYIRTVPDAVHVDDGDSARPLRIIRLVS
jgi:hypothetical protein